MKCRRCREPAVIDVRRHNAAFCRDCFLHHCREQVRKAIDHYEMLAPGERVLVAISGGKDSLAAWDLLRARLRGRRPLPRSRHRRVLRPFRTVRASLRRAHRRPAARDRPARRLRLLRSRRRARRAPLAVRRVRPLEASPLQLRRDRGRLRRRRDGPQPRRRGRGAARQRAALGDRVPRASVSGAAGRARFRAQDQAARAAGRTRDGRLLRAPGHRLHRRRVPDGRGQPAPRIQGGAERARRAFAGHEGGVPQRIPRARARALRRRRRAPGARRPAAVHPLRLADTRRAVRVLPAAGAGPAGSRGGGADVEPT